MKTCDKCHISIETNQKYCPLCHQTLKGKGDPSIPEVYPEFVATRREFLPTTKKILLFLTITSIIILLSINLFYPDGTLWSFIPIGGILYFWVVLRYGILSKQNIAFKMAFLTTILIAILNLIDQNYGTHQGWALDYVTPFALLACNLAISMIMWIKRLNYRDYIFYLLTIIVFSLIPLILFWFNVIQIAWPSQTAFALALFILLFIIIFFPKSIKDEIKKRFHI
ncbi:MAG: DUF6320 domain-containing protein [Candidatus Izemoplasmatales bacterium]|jgi:hypothetical protein|nr:DUF6320 domain-containing protein [Candidatus Izemoplasmatales bacterium]